MPANSSLLDLRVGYEFQGDGADVLGVNPLLVHGTGVTFPGGGGVHLDGSTGWLEADDSTFGALRTESDWDDPQASPDFLGLKVRQAPPV